MIPALKILAEIGGIVNLIDSFCRRNKLTAIEFLSGKFPFLSVCCQGDSRSPAFTCITRIISGIL